MESKQYPANFLANSIFFFLLFLIPFLIIRLYFYFNYYFPRNAFDTLEFFKLLVVGVRFDLCVVGFLIMPSYFFYLLSYFSKTRPICFIANHIYKLITLVAVFAILYFNLAFISVNLPFDLPYWMRWEDFRSIVFLDCRYCFWDYDYFFSVYPIQFITALLFLLILFASFSRWQLFSKEFNFRRELILVGMICLIARGTLGQNHLRYEDSIWHPSVIINELSNNPVWLLGKIKSDRHR